MSAWRIRYAYLSNARAIISLNKRSVCNTHFAQSKYNVSIACNHVLTLFLNITICITKCLYNIAFVNSER